MSYEIPFYLERAHGGNGALVPDSLNVHLRIASIKDGSFDDIRLSEEIAFASTDDDVVRVGFGLDSFIRTEIGGTPAVIFDNHNHALYFWYEWRKM